MNVHVFSNERKLLTMMFSLCGWPIKLANYNVSSDLRALGIPVLDVEHVCKCKKIIIKWNMSIIYNTKCTCVRERFSNTVAVNISANFPGCFCNVNKSTKSTQMFIEIKSMTTTFLGRKNCSLNCIFENPWFLHLCDKKRLKHSQPWV